VAAGPILTHLLQCYFSAGVAFTWTELRRYLKHPKAPDRWEDLRLELEDALTQNKITPAEFEQLTSCDQDTQADVDAFLLKEIWEPLFGDQ
jgi:hypothetical protein